MWISHIRQKLAKLPELATRKNYLKGNLGDAILSPKTGIVSSIPFFHLALSGNLQQVSFSFYPVQQVLIPQTLA
jgi:hypothetical protein